MLLLFNVQNLTHEHFFISFCCFICIFAGPPIVH